MFQPQGLENFLNGLIIGCCLVSGGNGMVFNILTWKHIAEAKTFWGGLLTQGVDVIRNLHVVPRVTSAS